MRDKVKYSELVMYPQFKGALERIQRCFESHSKHGLVDHLRLFGSTGVGKTTVAGLFMSMHPTDDGGDRTVMPVLKFIVPADPTPAKLLTSILEALGDPAPEAGSQKTRLLKLINNCGVQMIIVDETQHLVDKGRAKSHERAADKLKEIEETLLLPMVFIGAPRSAGLFAINSQLRSRSQTTFYMRPFYTELAHGGDLEWTDNHGDSSESKDEIFRAFLEALLRRTHFNNKDFFDGDDQRLRCFYATDGVQRTIYRLIHFASTMFPHEKTLNYSILSEVFMDRIYPSAKSRQNPFSMSFEMRRLTLSGEPFEPSLLDGDNHDW